MSKLTPRMFVKCFRDRSGPLGDACSLLEKTFDENDRLHAHLRQRELAEELRADDEAHRAGLGVLLGMED